MISIRIEKKKKKKKKTKGNKGLVKKHREWGGGGGAGWAGAFQNVVRKQKHKKLSDPLLNEGYLRYLRFFLIS